MKVTKTYFMVMVADMDRAMAFYGDVFGLSVVFQSPEWTELSSGGAVVALHHGADEAEQRDTGLGFEVDDLQAACAAVEAGGGRVVKGPQDRPGEPIRLAMIADPEGNVLSVAQPTWGS